MDAVGKGEINIETLRTVAGSHNLQMQMLEFSYQVF
jgi:hypothetical protein